MTTDVRLPAAAKWHPSVAAIPWAAQIVVAVILAQTLYFKFTYAPETQFTLALIGGAITTHLTSLGIVVKNPDTGEGDGGLLFGLALGVAAGSLVVLWYRWRQLPFVGKLVTGGAR